MSSTDSWVSENLPAIARSLEKCLLDSSGERIGFILVLTPFVQQTPSWVQYAANIERSGASATLQHLLKRWQSGQPDVTYNQRN